MLALMVLLVFGIYALVSLGVIVGARAMARRRGGRPWLWGWAAALVMYHLVFWDLIPTAILYPRYQANEAGLWVYKTKDEWLAENPGFENALTKKELAQFTSTENPFSMTFRINQRINWVQRHTSLWPQITRIENTLVDISTGDVLLKGVYFQSGDCRLQLYHRPWIQHCGDGEQIHEFRNSFYPAMNEYSFGRLEK